MNPEIKQFLIIGVCILVYSYIVFLDKKSNNERKRK